MKKKIMFIILMITICYLVGIITTYPLGKRVEKSMVGYYKGEVWEIEKYSIPDYVEYEDAFSEVKLLLSIHNFKDGYVWAYYSRWATKDEETIYGSWGVLARWKIHKENGQWDIIAITEQT